VTSGGKGLRGSIVGAAVLAALLVTGPAAVAAAKAKASGAAERGAPDEERPLPTVAAKVADLAAHPGLLTFYTDAGRGRVWLRLPPATGERGEVGSYLYLEGLVQGVGSNPVGLDRGQSGEARVVSLRRLGGRVLIEQQNLRFRALSDDPGERRAVAESFATSVLWAGPVAALDPDGTALVDFTSFLLRDAHGVAATLKATGQGSYALDEQRSAVDLGACLAFPENLEFEALLTYAGSDPGRELRSVVPAPEAVTVVEHQSLVRLPDPGYHPRVYDPRTGFEAVTFTDYATPLDQPIEQRWAIRYRLEKVDPTAARSRVKKPIVYYVDPGTPEPVRSALVEGASWWAKAFDAAGFIDAYRVELLPPGVNPLDARYNVIQWVHRSTRGWSYGGGIVDPRTGEMVKGHVWLGSLRVRQDRLLFEGLAGTAKTGTGAADDPVELALARIRQLAAHEVGHSLGLAHNFAASTYGGRASVMDYPAPLVGITPGGDLDFSHAYGVGVGVWDLHTIRWGYSELPPGTDEAAALDAIAREGIANGLLYMSDEDARPPGSAHPLAHLWDNGADPVAELGHTMQVRAIALGRFGEGNVAPGQPLARLEEVLATVYLHHRYQVQAAIKVIGGVDYRYALRGDGQPPAHPVDGAWQRRALTAVLATLDPAALDLPDSVLALLPPRPAGYPPDPEEFGGATGPVFDPLGAAATATRMVTGLLLDPARAARLVDQHRRDPALPGLEEVLDGLVAATFGGAPPAAPRRAEIRRTVESVVAFGLTDLAAEPAATPGVRERVEAALRRLADSLRGAPGAGEEEGAHRAYLAGEIGRFLDRRSMDSRPHPAPPEAPPGSPIGTVPAGPLGGCSQDGGG
jgi:Met-zincin/Domain of unknown function (DUF5117)